MSLQQWFNDIPVVTRVLFTSNFAFTLLPAFGFIAGRNLVLTWDAISHFEIWRFYTCFFVGSLGLPFLMHLVFLYRYSTSLEQGTFAGRTGDYLWMQIVTGITLLLIGLWWPFAALGKCSLMVIIYYWARMNQNAIVSFYFGIQFPAAYLPWALTGMHVLLGASPVPDGKSGGSIKFAQTKKLISPNDPRLIKKNKPEKKKEKKEKEEIVEVTPVSSALFFRHNTQLGPPYYILLDTNFINFSIQNKLEIMSSMMDCLFAKCIPVVTDCVLGELERLGRTHRLALRLVQDERFERLTCQHKGIYADDCLVERVTQHKCYIVATCDRDLKRRIRRIPGVPIMYIRGHRYSIERMPEAYGAPAM